VLQLFKPADGARHVTHQLPALTRMIFMREAASAFHISASWCPLSYRMVDAGGVAVSEVPGQQGL
jgi:hypothetical protein